MGPENRLFDFSPLLELSNLLAICGRHSPARFSAVRWQRNGRTISRHRAPSSPKETRRGPLFSRKTPLRSGCAQEGDRTSWKQGGAPPSPPVNVVSFSHADVSAACVSLLLVLSSSAPPPSYPPPLARGGSRLPPGPRGELQGGSARTGARRAPAEDPPSSSGWISRPRPVALVQSIQLRGGRRAEVEASGEPSSCSRNKSS